MRNLILGFILLACISYKEIHASCAIGNQYSSNGKAKANDAENYLPACAAAIKKQVKVEFEAAMQYLLMGAYFDQDNVNLPGIYSKFSPYIYYDQHIKLFIISIFVEHLLIFCTRSKDFQSCSTSMQMRSDNMA